MFFGGDGSTYVTQFCDLADHALSLSQPNNQEINRANAADFVLNLSEVFNQRVFDTSSCELSIHMRY